MIGMSQIRKRLIYGIAIGAGIGLIGIVITLIWSISVVNSYKKGTNKNYIAENTKEITMLNVDVTQGETITDKMLTKQRVHKKTIPSNLVGEEIVGQIAKYNIPANIPLVASMFGKEIVSIDERIQEVNTVKLPADLANGNYIDIKIKMASGLEYVVIPQIQVKEVRGTTMLLHLNDEDLYYLNSAVVDTYLSDGAAVLYGVKYVDEDSQIKLGEEVKEGELKLSAADMARRELYEKIESDVAAGTEVLPIPDEVLTENVTNSDTTGSEQKESKKEKEEPKESQEFINFKSNLTDLILKYAIEYRYYVESYNKIERTYQPSDIVMEHMRTNEHITAKAKAKLSEDVRREIEANIEQFKNSVSEEEYKLAVSGLEAQITAQQTLRNEVLNKEQ